MRHLTLAKQCWRDVDKPAGELELLLVPGQSLVDEQQRWVQGCLMDLQLHMDAAMERRQVRWAAGEQLELPLGGIR